MFRDISTRVASSAARQTLQLEPLEPRILLDGAGEAIELFNASPAVFVENQGQWTDETVQYAFDGASADIAFRDDGLEFRLSRQVETEEDAAAVEDPHAGPEDVAYESIAFSVSYDGGNIVDPVGLGGTDSRFNYFIGDQPNWREGVAGYEVVAYEGLYDGIDLHAFGRRDSLKYEFYVAPGADYTDVQISYDGIDGLFIDDEGRLHVQTAFGDLIDDAPVIYQDIDGERVTIEGAFRLIDDDTYGFEVTGPWDASRELVLDPDLDWSTYLGGSSAEYGYGIAVDGSGGVYVTGDSYSAGWTSGGFDTSYNGGSDAFVTKLTNAGGHAWSTYLGGSGTDYGYGIAVDGSGGVYVSGSTTSSGWTSGGFDTSHNGNLDAFVAKLTDTGGHAWSTYLGGGTTEYGHGIAVDGSGGVYVLGYTGSSGWVSGGFDTSHNGGTYDAFVAKLTDAGGHAWSTYLGGNSGDYGYGIAVDGSGGVYVSGTTTSSGWTSGGFDTSYNSGADAFVAKLTDAGGHTWSTYLGGSSTEQGRGIATDGSGGVYVTGITDSSGWTSGGFDTSHNGGTDAFAVKLTDAGGHAWSTYLGGSTTDDGEGIAVDGSGGVYVSGRSFSSGWASGGFDTSHNGESDAFVANLTDTGGHTWSTYLGGSGDDAAFGIAVDGSGGVYVMGFTGSSGWTSGGFDTSHNGGSDAFVAKIVSSAPGVTSHLYADGVRVTVVDTNLGNGITTVNIAWDPSEYVGGTTHILIDPGTAGDGIIDKIHFLRGGNIKDVGVMVSNATGVTEFLDDRSGGELAFLMVQGALTTGTFHRPLKGANMNGVFDPGGWGFADVDQDGSTTDKTGVGVEGNVGTLDFKLGAGGETVVDGNVTQMTSTGAVASPTVTGDLVTLNVNNAGARAIKGPVFIGGNSTAFTANGHVKSEIEIVGSAESILIIGGRLVDSNRANDWAVVEVGGHLTMMKVYDYAGPVVNVIVGDVEVGGLLGYFSVDAVNKGDFRGALTAGAIDDAYYHGDRGVKKPITTTGANGTDGHLGYLEVSKGNILANIDTQTHTGAGQGHVGKIDVINGGLSGGASILVRNGLDDLWFSAKVAGTVDVAEGDFKNFLVRSGDVYRATITAALGWMRSAEVRNGNWTDSSMTVRRLTGIDVSKRIRDLNAPTNVICATNTATSFTIEDMTGSATVSTANNHVSFAGIDAYVG